MFPGFRKGFLKNDSGEEEGEPKLESITINDCSDKKRGASKTKNESTVKIRVEKEEQYAAFGAAFGVNTERRIHAADWSNLNLDGEENAESEESDTGLDVDDLLDCNTDALKKPGGVTDESVDVDNLSECNLDALNIPDGGEVNWMKKEGNETVIMIPDGAKSGDTAWFIVKLKDPKHSDGSNQKKCVKERLNMIERLRDKRPETLVCRTNDDIQVGIPFKYQEPTEGFDSEYHFKHVAKSEEEHTHFKKLLTMSKILNEPSNEKYRQGEISVEFINLCRHHLFLTNNDVRIIVWVLF